MRACGDDTSSGDDDQKPSQRSSCSCARSPIIAPVLALCMDELNAALDVLTVAQQDWSLADQEPVICDPWASVRVLISQASVPSTGGRARSSARFPR